MMCSRDSSSSPTFYGGCMKPQLKVKPHRMKAKLERLGKIAAEHPDRKVREGLREVMEQVHNRHVDR